MFQQDSVPAHCARQTIRVPQRETPTLWPSNSPDFSPVDYQIWGVIEYRMYQTPVRDVADLRQRLITLRMTYRTALWTMLLMNGARDFRPV